MKPGWQSSETWLAVVSQLLGAGLAILGAMPNTGTDPKVQISMIVVGALASIVTQIQHLNKRTELKKEALQQDDKGLPIFYASPEISKKIVDGNL